MTNLQHIDNIRKRKEMLMIVYPDYYCNKVTDITIDLLMKHHIQGILLDVDNTLIDFDRNLLEGAKEWVEKVKNHHIKCMILSNSNKHDKVMTVAQMLDLPYLYFATKPLKRGFKKAREQLGLENEKIAVVGDQIFTDVMGANRNKMFSILVNPIAKKDIWITKLKRPLEELIIQSYVKKQKKKEE